MNHRSAGICRPAPKRLSFTGPAFCQGFDSPCYLCRPRTWSPFSPLSLKVLASDPPFRPVPSVKSTLQDINIMRVFLLPSPPNFYLFLARPQCGGSSTMRVFSKAVLFDREHPSPSPSFCSPSFSLFPPPGLPPTDAVMQKSYFKMRLLQCRGLFLNFRKTAGVNLSSSLDSAPSSHAHEPCLPFQNVVGPPFPSEEKPQTGVPGFNSTGSLVLIAPPINPYELTMRHRYIVFLLPVSFLRLALKYKSSSLQGRDCAVISLEMRIPPPVDMAIRSYALFYPFCTGAVTMFPFRGTTLLCFDRILCGTTESQWC